MLQKCDKLLVWQHFAYWKLIDPTERGLLAFNEFLVCSLLCVFVALAELTTRVFSPFLVIGELRTCKKAG